MAPPRGRQPASFAQPEFGSGRYDAQRWQSAEREQTLLHLAREGYAQTMQGEEAGAVRRGFWRFLRFRRPPGASRLPPVEL